MQVCVQIQMAMTKHWALKHGTVQIGQSTRERADLVGHQVSTDSPTTRVIRSDSGFCVPEAKQKQKQNKTKQK